MRMQLSLGQNISCRQEQRLEQRISHEQKIGLECLMVLKQLLKDPELKNASKGLEGMASADDILRRRESRGLLIGGLTFESWKKGATKNDFYHHKDVDVMVLDKEFGLEENFEGGIDWWIPETDRYRISTLGGSMESDVTSWVNGNYVRLGYGVELKNTLLAPGLYIPHKDTVVETKVLEMQSQVDYGKVAFDDETFEVFEARERRKMGSNPSLIAKKNFPQAYLNKKDIEAYSLGLESLRAVNSGRKVVREEVKHDG